MNKVNYEEYIPFGKKGQYIRSRLLYNKNYFINIKMYFNINEFINIVLPVLIKHAPSNSYYVKGGKAYDIYFKDDQKSIDYDISGNYDFLNYIDTELNSYATKHNLNLIKLKLDPESTIFHAELHQYGFQDYFYSDDKDPYFLDILIHDTEMVPYDDFFKINDINYMSFNKFFTDLIDVTLENRYTDVKKYSQYTLKKVFNDFDSFKITYSDTSFIENIQTLLSAFKNYINEAPNDQINAILMEYYYRPLVVALNDHINDRITLVNLLEAIIQNPVPDEKIDMIEDDDLTTGEIQDGINEFFSLLIRDIFVDRTAYYKKYMKTRRRYKNIIDISWTNLTDAFKMFLIDVCNSPLDLFSLIELSDTCKVYMDCGNKDGGWPTIIKNTSRCVD